MWNSRAQINRVGVDIEDEERLLLQCPDNNVSATSSNAPTANHPLPESFQMFRAIAATRTTQGNTNGPNVNANQRKASQDSTSERRIDITNSAKNREVYIENKYNVIEFIELQENNIGVVKYLCVLNTWIKWRNNKDKKITFFYPNEPQYRTNERIKNNEKYSENWTVNVGTVKYSTDSCENAFSYMNRLNNTKYLNRSNADASTSNAQNAGLSTGLPNTDKTYKIAPSQQDELQKLFKDMQTTIDSNFKQIFTLYSQTCEILVKMSSFINNQNELNSSPSTSNGNQNDTQKKNGIKAPIKKRSLLITNTVNLPPEYDENNSRWTLKHRRPGPGLSELVPHTKIYVNTIELSTCLLLSDGYKELVKMLLKEIFTISALKACSVGIRRSVGPRPGLDENAKKALIKYVAEHGGAKGWQGLTRGNILSAIRTALLSFKK